MTGYNSAPDGLQRDHLCTKTAEADQPYMGAPGALKGERCVAGGATVEDDGFDETDGMFKVEELGVNGAGEEGFAAATLEEKGCCMEGEVCLAGLVGEKVGAVGGLDFNGGSTACGKVAADKKAAG